MLPTVKPYRRCYHQLTISLFADTFEPTDVLNSYNYYFAVTSACRSVLPKPPTELIADAIGNVLSSPLTDAGHAEDKEESGRQPFNSLHDSDRRSTDSLHKDASSSASELPSSSSHFRR